MAWRPHKPVPAAPASGDSRCGWRRAQGRAQGLGSHRHSPPPRSLQGPGHLPGPPAGALAGPLRPGRPGWHQLLSCPEGGPALPCRGEAGVDRGQEAGRPWLSTPPLPGPPGALRLLQQHLGPEPAVPAGAAGGAGPRRQLRGGPGAAALPAAVPAAGHAHPGGQPTLPAARLRPSPPGARRRAGGSRVPAPWPAGAPLCPPERARSQQIPGDPPRARQGLLTGAPSHIAGGLAAAPTPPWATHNWTPKGHTYLGQALAHVCSWESSMHAPCRAQSPRGVGYAHPAACRPRSEVPLCWGPHHLGQSSLHPPGCFCPPRG